MQLQLVRFSRGNFVLAEPVSICALEEEFYDWLCEVCRGGNSEIKAEGELGSIWRPRNFETVWEALYRHPEFSIHNMDRWTYLLKQLEADPTLYLDLFY